MAKRNIQKPSHTRVWTFEGRAGPGSPAIYQGLGRVTSPDWAGGDITPIRGPSETRYGDFDIIDVQVGQKGLPSLGVEMRLRRDMSDMLTLFQKGCPIDIQAHVGSCTDPTDFLAFEKIHVLEQARMTNYGSSDLGAFDADQDNPVVETLPFTGLDYYEVVPIRHQEIGESEIVQEIVAVAIPDELSCGDCANPSDGASIIFAITKTAGGSPGLPAELIYTDDAGATLGSTIIDTLGANEEPTGMAAVGPYLVIISNDDEAIHYAAIADILEGTETWTRVSTGIVAAKGPNAIFSTGRAFTWIVGDGGYIYFSSDITAGFDPQTDGGVTTENLLAIHGVDDNNLVAVGENNAVLVTTNGGNTWTAITGPNVGVNLRTIFMKTDLEWFVGDAGGNLWHTRDGGDSWTAVTFSGSGAGIVYSVVFATPTVGYMAHTTAASVGRIFRSVDGGATWYTLPEAAGISLTDNDKITALAVPTRTASNIKANTLWAGGLAADAADGILLKIA